MKATIQKYRGDLDTAESVCADLEIGRDEFTPTASPKRSTSCKRPKDPDRALFESLQKRVAESGSILKDLSKAQLQPITSRTSFASYVKDSLLTMSKANFKKARSSINRLLTDLMDEDSDDDDDMPGATGISSIPASQQTTHPQKSHQMRSSSASSFSSFSSSEPSTSEQYQPAPHLWRNVPPASSVWGFSVYGVYGAVPPATPPASTSADAHCSSADNTSAEGSTVHHYPKRQPSV